MNFDIVILQNLQQFIIAINLWWTKLYKFHTCFVVWVIKFFFF